VKKKKNLIVVTDSDFPSGSASAKLLRLLCYGFSENNWSVSVLLQKGKQNRNIEENEVEGCFQRKISYKYFAWKYRPKNFIAKFIDSSICFFGVIFKLIHLKILQQVDYVLVYNHFGVQNLSPLIICKVIRIPVVSYVADWLTKDVSFPKKSQVLKYWNFQLRMKYINFLYDGIISTSTYINDYYHRKHFESNRLYILPNLIEKPTEFDIYSEKEYPRSHKIRITFSGKPTWTNGGEMLLDIFSKVHQLYNDCELIIIGDQLGNKQLLPLLKDKAQELGVANNVIFTGMISYQRVIQILQTSDIFILPRPSGKFAEAGFPTKLGEYLAARKPVIVSKVGDIPNYLTHKQNILLCKPGDIECFVENIIWLINNPSEASDIGENGFKWVIDNLDYNNATKKIIKYFSSNFDK
jgi:glycosyltransferase involved in cell wall biosynthesis